MSPRSAALHLTVAVSFLALPAADGASAPASPPTPVQDQPVPPSGAEQEGSMFRGTLVEWDDAARTFTVQGDTEGQEMQFTWDETTTLEGAPAAGERVEVAYVVVDGQYVATHVRLVTADEAGAGAASTRR